MLTYYIYSLETNRVVAVITGTTNEACERAAEQQWSSNDYAGTYTPAFGIASGLPDLDGSEVYVSAK